jgi:hypothetical protein
MENCLPEIFKSKKAIGTISILILSAGLLSGLALVRKPQEIREKAATGPVLAFPGAEGFGAYAKGGRGDGSSTPQIFIVSNLNDSGPGSLRACVEDNGPRFCIFRVAGTINLNSSLIVENPYITIAGQTAPGDGITLRNGTFQVKKPTM